MLFCLNAPNPGYHEALVTPGTTKPLHKTDALPWAPLVSNYYVSAKTCCAYITKFGPGPNFLEKHNKYAYQNKVTSQTSMSHVQFVTVSCSLVLSNTFKETGP